jgi:hypothetical protein
MKVASWTCDGCGVQKGEMNHWWLVDGRDLNKFICGPWNETAAGIEGFRHICSENCAIKELSQWLGKKKAAGVTEHARYSDAERFMVEVRQ